MEEAGLSLPGWRQHPEPVTGEDWRLAEIRGALNELNRKADHIMAAQDDINAAVAAIQAFFTDLGTAVADIKTELAAVAPSVDTTALNALVEQLPAVQASVDALEVPAAPTA